MEFWFSRGQFFPFITKNYLKNEKKYVVYDILVVKGIRIFSENLKELIYYR